MKRFWDKVDIKGTDDCWLWKAGRAGGRSGKDYGYFRVSNPRRQVYAHRFAFFLTHGFEARVARHTCDTPLCCNPKHIINGTQADNVKDKCASGNTLRGSAVGNSKLSETDVHEIHARLARGERHTDIAKDYDVCPATVTAINAGKIWKHLTNRNNVTCRN